MERRGAAFVKDILPPLKPSFIRDSMKTKTSGFPIEYLPFSHMLAACSMKNDWKKIFSFE